MENQLIKSKGINFGIAYGLFLILLTLYAYAIDLNFFASFWFLGLVMVGFFCKRPLGNWQLKKNTRRFCDF